ncbi:ankyrin repeat domain-containing protein [Sphingomicrobium astaxanthinifaciens]|uniref:ankyrin repeat domain-containing protein n=1 Tax=Sphingomicrobium astaxanthinifaciens TaxID=1227949 RepID=UPI001FCCA3E4|nr:ankyrin repeat domain-containing protein [Sphingomicrobium astaxanthinifaciens]MCJ7421162.1 ankyrin repeat domain-containing protein [Sphingomicrobium astaxanthinifaciens]
MARFLFAALAGLTLVTAPAGAAAQGRSDGESFVAAVREGDSGKTFEFLNSLDFRALDYRSVTGETALHVALADKRPSWVRLLLQRGANPDLKRGDGMPPLMIATERQDLGSVEALLRRRANPNATNRAGETALMLAVRLRNADIVKALLDKGADADIADSSAGLSARDYARRDTRNPQLLALIEAAEAPASEADDAQSEGLTFGPILR